MRIAALVFLVVAWLPANAEKRSNVDFNYSQNYSQSADAAAINEGISVAGATNNSRDSFYAFSTTFPQAHGCFGGAQGGLGDGGSSGFFGFHFINENCWTSALAGAQANIEVKARLQCAGKVFRNAIAYDQRSDRQGFCVGYMIEKYRAEIEHANAQVESAVELGQLAPLTADTIIAANVTEEEFEEQLQRVEDKNAQQQNQIDELRRRTRAAEARAAEAEAALQALREAEQLKRQRLLQLQQELRSNNESPETE